ncbi:hypothetical protein EON80_18035, partial [bacterium]
MPRQLANMSSTTNRLSKARNSLGSLREIPLHRKRASIAPSALLLSLLPSLATVAGAQTPADSPPMQSASLAPSPGVVLAITGERLTLSVGTEKGARIGAIYAVIRDGQTLVTVQIREVQADRSGAVVVDNKPETEFAVGDTVQFIAEGMLPVPVITVPEPVTPLAPEVPPVSPPSTENEAAVTTINSQPAIARAAVTSIEGAEITVAAGSQASLRVGQNLPLLRGEEAIGMLKVRSVGLSSSVATVLWQDESAGPVRPGDNIQFPRPGKLPTRLAGNGAEQGTAQPDPNAGFTPVKGAPQIGDSEVPTAQLRFETGASNLTVPRADRTYQYLAALAASGAIVSQPSSVFEDEGVRYHRTAEDLIFTRSQIASLIKEALDSGEIESSSQSFIADELVREYRPELQQLGVSLPSVENAEENRGLRLAISGRQSATAVFGDKEDAQLPFSERQGGLRTRNGFDTRLNIFGRAGKRVTFAGSLDAGSSPGSRRNSLGGDDDDKSKLRRASLSYDAGHILKGLTLQAGRDELWLGPGHFGTLLLGDAAGPLNMLSYKFKRGPFSMGGYYAPLGRGPLGGKRSLYVRETQLKIGSQARIGFSESVLSPRDSFDPALFASAFSPVPLFLLRDNGSEDNQNGNLQQSFFAEVGLAAGLQAYGELLVDDIGVTNANLAENRIGSLLGVHVFKPNNPGKLGMYGEYARLAGRTYLRFGNFDLDYDYYYR